MTSENTDHRLEVALACERFVSNDYRADAKMHDEIIVRHTLGFTDTTCAIIASVVGTQYEAPVISFVRINPDPAVIADAVRLMTGLDYDGKWALNGYALALHMFRCYFNLEDARIDIDSLVIAANLYRDKVGDKLPSTTENEEMLINFLAARPDLKEALLERATTVRELNPEMLNALLQTAPALIDGVL